VQPQGGTLYPPDLHQAGIDLDALVVVHVPPDGMNADSGPGKHTPAGVVRPHRLCKAAELLLRSGAFGMLVLDLCDGTPHGSDAWQGRLLGLARAHHARVVLLTNKPRHADSLGTLVGLRVEPQRFRTAAGQFTVEHQVLKNKSGAPFDVARDHYQGPCGLL
jgi:recombination protein RecA